MKSFRKIMICILSIFMLSACSKPAESISISDAFKYLSGGQYKEAIDAFTAIIKENPKSEQAYSGRGDAYAYSGEYVSASADYAKAEELCKDNVLYLLKNAVIYSLLNENSEADNHLKKAGELSNGTITLWDASEVTDLITKLKAEDSSKAVLEFINTALKEDETAAVPASETPKAESTPTPTPETKPKGSGTLEDITNLDELLDCIDNLMTPIYMEEHSTGSSITIDPYDHEELYGKVKKYQSLEDYRNHYKQFMTDNADNVLLTVGVKFAMHSGELYYNTSPQFGWGSVSKQDVILKEIDNNGDYHISVPIVFGPTLEDAEY